MSLNSLIISTLKPLGVPVEPLNYDGNEDTYITFFEFNQTSQTRADDKEIKTKHSIQVDIWSNGDYTNLTKQVKNLLISVGFVRRMETETFEEETKTYHKVLRFNYVN
ncbi:hypothetical protein J27TS8_05270 [Robertmurraya siralis]|uniref:Uncharacterized protein n=1 Tax=Robertmurraya siralis TaxID=77777 RepID=A0A919WEX0_9BACI|nr:hypothetical protein [Robertmurraya siralis]PAE21963.1 hypothetical protein CHH80_03440 [Bacillus sp. 7504-2]GIN60534.1 hypothetical protein J27TS8_05270 [Robertmurraya siralis]